MSRTTSRVTSRTVPTAQDGQLDAFDDDLSIPPAGDALGDVHGDAESFAGDFHDASGPAVLAGQHGIGSGVAGLALELSVDGQHVSADASHPAGEPLVTRSIWVSLDNGEQLHLRHFLPALEPKAESPDEWRGDDAETALLQRALAGAIGRSVFMLHGEAECGRVYYDSSHRGLARYLARRGYEVFVADLGGRGRSLVPGAAPSSLTVDQLVCEAIPALLRGAARHSILNPIGMPDSGKFGPDVWIAHGFGAVLLSATWARLAEHERCAQQWVFFAGRRRFTARKRLARLFVKLFCHPLTERWVSWRNLFPATRLGLGSADENASWFRTYAHWMHARDWRDSDDEFDYKRALFDAQVPATLHLAAAGDEVFSNLEDIRGFIAELGPHDARLVVVDQVGQGKRRYNHLAMLLDEAAEQDIFEPLDQWLAQAGNRQCTTAQSSDASDAPQAASRSASGYSASGYSAGDTMTCENRIDKQLTGQAWQREVQHEIEVERYYNLPEAEASIKTPSPVPVPVPVKKLVSWTQKYRQRLNSSDSLDPACCPELNVIVARILQSRIEPMHPRFCHSC